MYIDTEVHILYFLLQPTNLSNRGPFAERRYTRAKACACATGPTEGGGEGEGEEDAAAEDGVGGAAGTWPTWAKVTIFTKSVRNNTVSPVTYSIHRCAHIRQ